MGRNGLRHAVIVLASVLAALTMAQRPDGPPRQGKGLPKNCPPILRKAFMAAFKLRYSGERVVSFRRGADRREHTEFVLKDGPRLRIWFPDDSSMAGQVIVENGRDRQHFLPANNEVHVGPAMHDDSFEKLKFFLRDMGPNRLRTLVGNGDAVAGIKTTEVSFMGSQGNVIQRIWIDEHSGLMLKRELYDPAGGLVGSFEFKKVNYSPSIRPSDFAVPPSARIITQEDLARRLMAKGGMLTAFLPQEAGRRLMGSRLLDRNPNSVALVLTYDIAEAQLSLIQVKGTFEPTRFRWMARKEFQTYTWQVQGRTFALIGEASPDALRRLADKVLIRPES